MTSLNVPMMDAALIAPLPSLHFDDVAFSHQGELLLGPCSFTLDGVGPTLVMGPNGAGKSLMLRLAHGLISPTQGSVSWSCGERPRQAMVFQQPVLLRRSALANLTHALAVNNTPRKARMPLAREALARFGLAARADTPHVFSLAANSSVWLWLVPGHCRPQCCFWMSRRPRWIPRRPKRSKPPCRSFINGEHALS